MRRRPTSLRSVAERQHRLAIWPVLSARVLTGSFNCHPMEGGRRTVCSECTRAMPSRGRVVRKLFVAGVGVSALFAVPAIAGDLPISAPIYAPVYRAPPIIALSWTGCYLGGHIGGSFIDKKFSGQFVDTAVPSTFGAPTSFAISESSTDLGSTGFLAGGQVGCNLQFATNWVIGIEADASWANSQGGDGSGRQTRSATLVGNLPGITTAVSSNGFASSKNDLIATATGRLGYTFGWAKAWSMPRAAPLGRATSMNSPARSRPPLAVLCRQFRSPRSVWLRIQRSSGHLTLPPPRPGSVGLSARV